MYLIKIFDGPNDFEGITIHTPNNSEIKIDNGAINREINAIDSFSFTILPNSPAYGRIRSYETLIKVWNTKTNEYDFEGRIYEPTESMDSSEIITYSYLAEGELAYLHDSQQQHVEFRGSVEELLRIQLSYHNSQVEEYKHFQLGTVTVKDPNDYVYLYLNAEEDTWESINRTLIGRLGGELRVRKVNGVRYLDYVNRVGIDSSVPIQLKKNLVSISRSVDASEIVTRLTPLGERIESENDEATDASQERLTISSVNNGLPYIDRQDLIDAGFGYRGGSQVWDDVTLPENLIRKGREWLDNQKLILYQYVVEALDLFLIGLDPIGFKVGNSHPLINPVMDILGERLRIIKQTIDINNPQDGSLTIGDKFKKASDYQVDMNKETRHIYHLQNTVTNLTQRTGTMKMTLDTTVNNVSVVQQTLKNIDADNLPDSISAIHGQLEDIKQSITDIDIPEYGTVTPTDAGLMDPYDKRKLDFIKATTFIDLDDLMQRVVELEQQPSEPTEPEDPIDPPQEGGI